MADDPADTERLARLLVRRPIPTRHAFLNGGTGAPALGSGDLAMVRTGADRFALLVPGVPKEDDAQCWSALMTNALSNGAVRRADRMAEADEALAISFVAERGPRACQDSAPSPSTGLERLLRLLRAGVSVRSAELVLPAYGRARGTLDEVAHPALRAVFRRCYADHLARLAEPDAVGLDVLFELERAYEHAAVDFHQCSLFHQERVSSRNWKQAQGDLNAPLLPGFQRDRVRITDLGFSIQRLAAVPLELPDLRLPDRAKTSHFEFHTVAGEVRINDGALVRALAGGVKGRARLLAEVARQGQFARIRLTVKSELEAFLGLPPRPRPDIAGAAVIAASRTLIFDPPIAEFDQMGSAEFLTSPVGSGECQFSVTIVDGAAQGLAVQVTL